MKTIKVHYDTIEPNWIITDINGTIREVREYYLGEGEGKYFNIGDPFNPELDRMVRACRVEILKEENEITERKKYIWAQYSEACQRTIKGMRAGEWLTDCDKFLTEDEMA